MIPPPLQTATSEHDLDPLGKSGQDRDGLAGNNVRTQFLVPTLRLAIWEASRAPDVTCECGCCHHLGTGEEALRVAGSHTALEVAIGGRNANVAFFQKSGSQSNARPTTRGKGDGAGVQEGLPNATAFRLFLHPCARRSDVELHARSDFA